MRGCKRRRVVHAIADHQDLDAPPLQFLDAGHLVCRRDACAPFMNAERPGRVAYRRLSIAGQNLDFNPGLEERGNGAGRVGAQALPHRKDVPRFAVTEGDDGSLRIPAQDFVGDLVRAAKRRPAQPDFEPVDEAAHTVPRYLLDPRQRRLCFGGPRHRGGDGMMAGQCKSPGEFEHVFRNIGGIRDVELRQGQRARLIEYDAIDIGQPLDGIAGIEQHAGPEHGA